MLSPLAYGLAIVLDLFIAFIGARFLLAPRIAAAGYGVPAKADGDRAYLAVKGVRDLSLQRGLAVRRLAIRRLRRPVGREDRTVVPWAAGTAS